MTALFDAPAAIMFSLLATRAVSAASPDGGKDAQEFARVVDMLAGKKEGLPHNPTEEAADHPALAVAAFGLQLFALSSVPTQMEEEKPIPEFEDATHNDLEPAAEPTLTATPAFVLVRPETVTAATPAKVVVGEATEGQYEQGPPAPSVQLALVAPREMASVKDMPQGSSARTLGDRKQGVVAPSPRHEPYSETPRPMAQAAAPVKVDDPPTTILPDRPHHDPDLAKPVPIAQAAAPVNLGRSRTAILPDRPHDDPDSSTRFPIVEIAAPVKAAGSPTPFVLDQPPETAQARETTAEMGGAPLKIHVSDIQTHMPAVIVETLAGPSHEKPEPAAIKLPHVSEPPQKQHEALKILKFEVEPAALGTISVRMRVTHSRVDIKIETESPSTSALLADARDRLTTAIGERGFALDSYDVRQNPSVPTTIGGQDGANADDRPPAHWGDREFSNEDRSGQRQRQSTPRRETPRREEKLAAIKSLGVML